MRQRKKVCGFKFNSKRCFCGQDTVAQVKIQTEAKSNDGNDATAGMTSKQPKIALRVYQKRMVQESINRNSIVLLPTGAGKTLIASEVIRLQHKSGRTKTLFLVPTCMLVEQQGKAIKQWTQLMVKGFMGGVKLPSFFDVLVSTPAAFLSARSHHDILNWDNFGLVVFDEIHHVLKKSSL